MVGIFEQTEEGVSLKLQNPRGGLDSDDEDGPALGGYFFSERPVFSFVIPISYYMTRSAMVSFLFTL
jgi:hypothetical protein